MSTMDTRAPARRSDVVGTADDCDLTTVGGRMAWARLRKHLTQNALAKTIERSRATVVQYEANTIDPPVAQINKVAIALGVTPEFLAFGKQGIDGIQNAAIEVVTIPEVTVGRDGEWNSGGYAFPKSMIDAFGVDSRGAKIYTLQQPAPAFNFQAFDRLIVDTKITAPVPERDMYLVKTASGMEVVRREPNVAGGKGKITLTGGKGQTQTVKISDLIFIGAIVGSVQKS